MKTISAFLLTVLASTALGWGQAQSLCYVRVDGNDVECNGLVDAPDVSGTGLGENCAFRTVGTAAARCILPGANIKIRGDAGGSWYMSERVTFMASGTPSSPIVIEGHGPTQPHIGGQYTLYVNSPQWTPDPANSGWFIPYSAGPIAAAYILTSLPYEHERIGLVNYLNSNAFNADANGHYVPGGGYYIGPGVHYDTTNSRLYIRLERTPQVTSYEQNYLNLGLGSSGNPQNYQILIAHGVTDPVFSIKTAADHLVFRNLSIEPGFTTVQIACPTDQVANNIVFENNTIWSGNDGAIRATCASRDITLRENEIRADIPYWVSWGDCKGSQGPCEPPTGGWRFAMIRPGALTNPGKGWIIERNLISGGHDGYVTQGNEVGQFTDPNDIIRIRYNVFEGFQDDPFEIEKPDVGRHDIYGNLIANSLVCIAIGQQTTNTLSSYGPFFFHSNTCLLLREPYVNRFAECTTSPCPTTCNPCQGGVFNESREYGHQYAFKLHRPGNATSSGLHVYNNTIVLTDSHPNAGMGVLSEDNPAEGNTDAMKFAEIFNNVFIKLNRRVGQGGEPKWNYTTDPTTVNWNLYWKIHNDGGPLLDAFSTTGGLCSGPTLQECQGKGDTAFIGSDPKLSKIEGFGCFAQTSAGPVPGGGESACDGVDRTTDPTFWKIKTGSEYWSPAMFIPEAGTTVVCGQGRGSVPSGFPQYPAIEGIPFDASDIGAIPCDVNPANWNVFPFNAIWKTNQIAGGVAPDGYVTAPTDSVTTIAAGNSVEFCGGKTDLDGAPPYTYQWQLTSGGSCPSIPATLCPGNVLFTNAGTCTYAFKVTDRWGLQDATPQQRTIVVGGGGGSCSDCSRCICDQF